jgi:uncharacterized protein YqgC (DUF456 family)
MTVIASLNSLTGAALGTRCKVYILVPAISFAVLAAAIVATRQGYQFWSLISVIILTGTAIQLGYLIGAWTAHRVGKVTTPPAGAAQNGAAALLPACEAVPLAELIVTHQCLPISWQGKRQC